LFFVAKSARNSWAEPLPFRMSSSASYPACVHAVTRFDELLTTPLTRGINALCWERTLAGDFSEVVRLLGAAEGIVRLDEARLWGLPVSAAGRVAVDTMISDLRLLREHGLAPELNCITAYPRDEEPGPIATDVFSFHADSAPIEAATWLCTYHGAASEGLANADAVRKVDVPAIRAELLTQFGGSEGEEFEEFLRDNCYDLHYAPSASGRPWSFGVGHLWRIACDWPGSPVPPSIHRAPATVVGSPRLLLIS
jgi:hypothetical protein